MNRIIVGVTGEDESGPAIAWAIQYAKRSHAEVEFVHVIDITWGVAPSDFAETALLEAEQQLRAQVERTKLIEPGVAIHPTVLIGSPNRALTEHAKDATLLVIGSSERIGDTLFSTRAARIAASAACTVIVIPSEEVEAGRDIVVGIDGSEASAAAVEFAAREADHLNAQLTVVYSWTAPKPWSASTSIDWPSEPGQEDRRILAEATAGLADAYPDLKIDRRVVSARPAGALYAAGVGARMLVVGSHGRHGFSKALLGSVSEELVLSLPCPVAVVR
jgi:nucleotide-binding universal stress UspA family protein